MTGKKRNKANKVCFSNKKSRVFQEVNLQVQRQAVSMTSPLHHAVSRAREPRAWPPDCAPCGCCGAGAASVGGLSLDTGRLADILAQRIPREERRAGGIGHREYALRGTLHQSTRAHAVPHRSLLVDTAPGVQHKRLWWEKEQRWVKMRLSVSAMRTIARDGLEAVAAKNGVDLLSMPYIDASESRIQWKASQPVRPPMSRKGCAPRSLQCRSHCSPVASQRHHVAHGPQAQQRCGADHAKVSQYISNRLQLVQTVSLGVHGN